MINEAVKGTLALANIKDFKELAELQRAGFYAYGYGKGKSKPFIILSRKLPQKRLF